MSYTEGAHDSPADTNDRLVRVGSKYQATPAAVADGDNTYLLVDSNGRLIIDSRAADPAASEVKTDRSTNNNSTTVATALTPTSGKKVRIISVLIAFEGSTSNGLEVYFGTGANIGTTGGKEIAEAHQAAIGPVFFAWPDGAGPVGAADDVVSLRGTAAVAEDVDLIVTYREE